MHRKTYQTTNSQVVWSCPWYQVRQDEFITPDGQAGVYNVVEKNPAVWIVPVTVQKEILLIYNYRYTVRDWCWEIPAGSVLEGQTIMQAAQAELLEEVGGTSQTWQKVTEFYTANGICNEVSHLFLATAVNVSQPQHESTELIEIHPTPIPHALEMARTGQMTDGPSALALLLCEQRLHSIWHE